MNNINEKNSNSNNQKVIRMFSMLFLTLSLLFVLPINFGYAADSSIPSSIKPSPKTVNEAKNTCGIATNVKDSLIMSIATICIPGILEKVKEWNEVSCEEVVCKYESIKAGIDPSYCEDQKEYKFCKFVWGELFLVPPLTIIEMVKDMIKELIANPIGILYGAGTKAARSYLTTCAPSCTSYTTIPVAGFLFVVDVTGTYQTLKEMFENGFDGNKVEQNFCEQARDIRDEMETIVAEYDKVQGGYY